MGKKHVNVAERLKELGYDPLEGMVRIAALAEQTGNLPLAGKIAGDLLEYTAPKLKSIEIELGEETLEALTPEQRRSRIRELAGRVGLDKVLGSADK